MSGKKNNVYDIFDKKEERRAIRKIFLFIGIFYVLTPIFVMMLILLLSLTVKPSFAISMKLVMDYMKFLYIFFIPLFTSALIGILIAYQKEKERIKKSGKKIKIQLMIEDRS